MARTKREQTIVIIWGSSGTGKTTLRRMLERGDRELVNVPALAGVAKTGFAQFEKETIGFLASHGMRENVFGPAKVAIGRRKYLLSDTAVQAERLVADCAGAFRLLIVCAFCYPWLAEARRDVRYKTSPHDPARERTRGIVPDNKLLDYVEAQWMNKPGIDVVLVDTSDYPIREMTMQDARAMVNSTVREPELPDVKTLYQRCLHIGGEWYGSEDLGRRQFEQRRLDALLPADLTGKTVLDIGASEGGMSYECINRGAIYSVAIERRAPQVELMRNIRTARQLPMTIAECDIGPGATIPRLSRHLVDYRYDLCLLLNVLHHLPDAETAGQVLGNLLDACSSMIVEGPFCDDSEVPYHPLREPHPNALCIPDCWVRAVGEAHGFRVDSVETSTMQPPHRRVWRLSIAA